ncbi:hypothetical protein C8Q70DRAFT_1020230 [Cubamyces menziesii]|nr:hypothetical protein C8Q70DRAFT_1020230 [Cubamyces menziesii]
MPQSTIQGAAYDVPMALDDTLFRTDGLEPRLAMSRLRRHVSLAKTHTLGPMPVDQFLEEFLPPSSEDPEDRLPSVNAFKDVPQSADSPVRIYKPLTKALNKKTQHKGRCPGFVFVNTNERSKHPSRAGHARPDICCFTSANAELVQKADRGSRTEFGYAELFIQVAPDPTLDFFEDPGPPSGATAGDKEDDASDFFREALKTNWIAYDAAEKAFGLSVAFAAEIFARQQRTFLFSIAMSGSFARLCRWDRVGCVISRAFDIREHPEYLTEFFWRFSALSDAQRGLDTTVELASPAEEALFRDSVRQHVSDQLGVTGEELDKAVSAHYQPGRVVVMHVFECPSGSESVVHDHRFLVSRPVVSPLDLTGRGTRGYWAVQVLTGRIAFLKDTWRTLSSQLEVEGGVLGHLNDLGICNVPTLATHGDVFDVCVGSSLQLDSLRTSPVYQETWTEEYEDEPWVCTIDGAHAKLSSSIHYRLVTYTVGYSLQSLRGTEELLRAHYDVFRAMRDALAQDSRIHRDLSVGNIILVKEPGHTTRTGYLIDWEASDRVDDQGEAVHSGRAVRSTSLT